jgi:hypothetical protein
MQQHHALIYPRPAVPRWAEAFCRLLRSVFPVLVLSGSLLFALPATADNSNMEQLQQRMEELNAEAAQTTDLNRLMAISQEMMELANQMAAELPGTEAPVPMQRAATPEAEIERQLRTINRAYRDGRKAISAHVGEGDQLVPLAKAARLRGKMQVRGHFIAPKESDWIPLRLSYIVDESFVGYVTVTDYFDLSTGRLSDKKDYYITSISTGITASGSGRECVERSYYSPPSCARWEQYAVSEISSGEIYPQFYAEVVRGAPEGGGMKVEVISPSIVFRSMNGRASSALGCFGSKINLSNTAFAASLQDGRFQDTQHVGREFAGTPGCSQGSQIEVSMELCDPEAFSEMDHCGAIEALLGEMEFILAVRDAFQKAIDRQPQNQARDIEHLFEIAGEELNQVYPQARSLKEAYLHKSTGGYDICNRKKIVPDQCKTSCSPGPLCSWQTEALDAHESTHQDDVESDPHLFKLSCNTVYRADNYPSNAAADRAEARAWGEMDVHAYNEQAKVMREIIERELNLSTGCPFEAGFYIRLQAAGARIR